MDRIQADGTQGNGNRDKLVEPLYGCTSLQTSQKAIHVNVCLDSYVSLKEFK